MINWKKFAAAALALDKEAFVMHMAYLRAKMLIYQTWKAQIFFLLTKKVSISKEYTDFSNVFSKELAAVLLECSNINEHAIDLEPGKQPPYRSI